MYAAGEDPISGADGVSLFNVIQKINSKSIFVKDLADLPMVLEGFMQDGDVLLLEGAGSIGTAALQLARRFKQDDQ